MNKSVLGIDLGTSSVKVLQLFEDGNVVKSKASYAEITPKGWWDAIGSALDELDLTEVAGISLSSQVGTYIINEERVISWNDPQGTEELREIKNQYEKEVFVKEISMTHPNLVSYPIPRLKYIKKHFENVTAVCQPKDYICLQLTGNYLTDQYSWRGLTNYETGNYSAYFLQELGVKEETLPPMTDYRALAGYTKEIKFERNILKAGIPVFVGLNDYYASLLGMGIRNSGELFDISGTSEHVGIVEDMLNVDTEMVSGPYLKGNVHYGVTASSGASIKFGLRLLDNEEMNLEKMKKSKPPIFLPYLKGERAPIWNPDARGMFFGIEEHCSKSELAYSVFEGVIFSLYHIYETMGMPMVEKMKVSGGAAVFSILNQLKAEMFEIPVEVLEENDTSALGAAMIAAAGIGWYKNLDDAIAGSCKIKEVLKPAGCYKEWMQKRYQLYKELYPAVKLQYEKLKE